MNIKIDNSKLPLDKPEEYGKTTEELKPVVGEIITNKGIGYLKIQSKDKDKFVVR